MNVIKRDRQKSILFKFPGSFNGIYGPVVCKACGHLDWEFSTLSGKMIYNSHIGTNGKTLTNTLQSEFILYS